MRYIVNDSQMKNLESYIINNIGIPSVVLMEKAALAVRDKVLDLCSDKDKILIVCGVGNNGADGLAVARLLHDKGVVCAFLVIGNKDKATDEWRLQYNILSKLSEVEEVTIKAMSEYNIIVDAIFGIGLKRNVEGEFETVIKRINEMSSSGKARVVAIDVPSGINSSTAKVMNVAVKADYTVTFAYEKTGIRMYPGAMYAGDKEIADIGISYDESYHVDRTQIYTHTLEDYDLLPKRLAYSNKGTYGKLMIIAGGKNMAGAAVFSGLSAYRMGTGLVYVLTREENRNILQKRLPEAVLIADDKEDVAVTIRKYADKVDAIVCGPGLGTDENNDEAVDMIKAVLKIKDKPVILDADALNIIAKEKLYNELSNNMILTPHIGEMARLTGSSIKDIKDDMQGYAMDFARDNNVTLVLKDAVSIVADKEGLFYLNSSGNSGMSTAGSGDVLTGIMGALCSMYASLDRHGIIVDGVKDYRRLAVTLAVYIHGLAGDYAKMKMGERPLISRDICKAVEKIMGEKEWKRLF
ncbi:MAG: NAD(P)H-hydrate dehydratase [Lachnospiraceae bacterium]|nr:NAD(P)H-hydrate dehydratase [Lachnospiraceae bacterium]